MATTESAANTMAMTAAKADTLRGKIEKNWLKEIFD
jgi:hypothetical protein